MQAAFTPQAAVLYYTTTGDREGTRPNALSNALFELGPLVVLVSKLLTFRLQHSEGSRTQRGESILLSRP